MAGGKDILTLGREHSSGQPWGILQPRKLGAMGRGANYDESEETPPVGKTDSKRSAKKFRSSEAAEAPGGYYTVRPYWA